MTVPTISLTKNSDGMFLQGEQARSALKQRFLRGHLPVKRSINFATIGEKPIDWRVAAPLIVCIVVLAGLLSKVAVIDRYAAVNEANREVYELQLQIAEKTEYYEGLEDIAEDYAHYTVSAMTDEERNRVSRVTVMEIVEDIILPIAPLDAWMLSDNTLYIHLSSNTMTEVTEMMQMLLDHPAVKNCFITTDSTTISSNDNIATKETVTAEVTVEFKRATDIQREEAARAAADANAANSSNVTAPANASDVTDAVNAARDDVNSAVSNTVSGAVDNAIDYAINSVMPNIDLGSGDS